MGSGCRADWVTTPMCGQGRGTDDVSNTDHSEVLMRASHRHIAWAGAVMSAAAIIAAAVGPALAVKSASNAWAVGYYQRGSAQYTLTEHWNGSRWTLVPSSSPATGQSRLHG